MKWIIGIDEVGRGSLAGPVAVAAIAVPCNYSFRDYGILKDSKKMSSVKRELWFYRVKNIFKFPYTLSFVSHSVIDSINIRNATNRAARRACNALMNANRISSSQCEIITDAGIFLGHHLRHASFIRGDETYDAIKLASIVAKVSSDDAMIRRNRRYPQYGFDIHKGYGTKMHREALLRHGLSEIHRVSFCSKYI